MLANQLVRSAPRALVRGASLTSRAPAQLWGSAARAGPVAPRGARAATAAAQSHGTPSTAGSDGARAASGAGAEHLAGSASASRGGRKRGFTRKLLKGIGVGLAAAAAGSYVYGFFDEGWRRSQQFWSRAFPIYMHYRIVQWRAHNTDMTEEEEEAAYEELHNKYAPQAEKLVYDMKGMYLKNAQLVSTRDEFLPPQYMEFCKRTQDAVPSEFAPGEARRMVEKSLGKKIEDVFEHFDDEVYGAASIGEVHRARLKGGQEVVVKIQFPNIEQRFRSDMKTMMSFCELAQPQHVSPLKEIEKQFMTEFDYRGEADNLNTVRENIMPVFGKVINIPRAHTELCTNEVMVMDFVPGERLIDGVRAQYRRYAESEGRTLEELEAEHKEKLARGEIQKRDVKDEARRTRALSAAVTTVDYATNSARLLYNWTAGWFTKPKEYKWSDKPINLAEILELLNVVHAHEIFIDGAFNGDPHPGNILLCPDGRIGLIDYGQVKRLPVAPRITLAKLIVALANDSREDVIDIYKEAGVRTRHMNEDILYRLACFWNDRDTDDVTGGRNIQTFMDWAQATDPLDEAPEDYIMAARVSVMMRGMANAFALRMRTAPMWLPVAERFLREQGVDPSEALKHKLAKERKDAAAKAAASAAANKAEGAKEAQLQGVA